MSLRFFADHCISSAIVLAMRDAGHEILLMRDHLPTESSDALVIAKAQELDAILLSQNGDFADIVAYPPDRFGGIVALEVRDHPEVIPPLMKNLLAYLARHPETTHYLGRLFIVQPARIRVRE